MTYVAAGRVVPAPRLLAERLAGVERRRLALDLEVDRPLHRAERVHVLDLHPGPERLRPPRPERHVRLHPHLAVLHLGVGDVDRPQEESQLLRVATGLLGRPDVGIGDDLHQRHAGPVEVDEADPAAVGAGGVDELRRVLLEVGPGDADPDRALGGVDRERPVRGEGQVVLADLVALRKVRVEVVLAVPAGGGGNRRPDRQPRRQHVLHGGPVDRREDAGEGQADRARVRVRGGVRRRDRAASRTSCWRSGPGSGPRSR